MKKSIGVNMSSQLYLFGPFMEKGANISACCQYRYILYRIWDRSLPLAMIVGLNPSTANAYDDDTTIRRCTAFMRREEFGGYYMLNLFAYRATEPSVMKAAIHPVGSENDHWLALIAEQVDTVIFAWGCDGGHLGRDKHVIRLLEGKDAYCFGHTKEGYPRHPLYLASDTPLIPFFTPAPHDDGFIFCCKHCQGPLDLIDDLPYYEVYKCESCGRQEVLEKTNTNFDEGSTRDDYLYY